MATWVLLRLPFGNWISGVGGSLQAARNVGVPTSTVKILLFIGTAVAACLLATIQVVSFSGADVLRGQYREFYAIVAVVIGGTLLTGGYGSATGAALGALIFGMVQQGIVYAGIDADWFQFRAWSDASGSRSDQPVCAPVGGADTMTRTHHRFPLFDSKTFQSISEPLSRWRMSHSTHGTARSIACSAITVPASRH